METRAFIASLALLLNSLVGGPRTLHARMGLGPLLYAPARAVAALERRLNRDSRTAAVRRLRGRVVTTVALLGASISGLGVQALLGNGLLLAVALALVVSLRGAVDRAVTLYSAINAGDETAARTALEASPWRNYSVLDTHTLIRAPIELLAVTFCDRLVAPLAWFMLAGLPGAWCAVTACLLAERLRPHGPFADAACIAEHWIVQPGKLGAVLLAAAACFLPFTRPLPTAMHLLALPLRAPSRVAALTVMGVGLNLSLGGPLSPYASDAGWVGGNVARAQPRDITRALLLVGTAALLLLVTLGTVMLWTPAP